MANTGRNPEVESWLERIRRAEAKRKEWHEEWEKNYKAIYGNDWMKDGKRDADTTSGQSKNRSYNYDLLLAFLKTELPTLVLHRPEVFLNVREYGEQVNPNAQAEAKKIEAKVNIILADMDGFETELRCILADAHCAYAIAKTLPVYEIASHPLAGQQKVGPNGEELFDPDSGEPILYPAEELKASEYDICRVDPFKFLIDKGAKNNPTKVPWMGEEIDRTLEELKQSGLYEPDLIAKLEAKVREKNGKDKKDWEIELKLYEVYDCLNEKIIVVCEDYPEDFLRFDDTPLGIEKDPYSFIKLTDIPGQWFPKPDITSGRHQQDDYREGRRWMKARARKANPQTGVKKSFWDASPEERDKIGDGVSDLVVMNGESDTWAVHKDMPHQNPALEEHMTLCMKDFDQVMGQSEQDRGLVGEAKFATEAEIAEVKGNMRAQDKLMLVKRFLSRTIEKLLFLMKQNPAEPMEIRGMMLNLDLDVEIDIESKSPKNRAIERKQIIEVMGLIVQNPTLMQSPTLLDQIFRDYDIRERQKIIQELQAAMVAGAEKQPEKKGLSMSLSVKPEMLPDEVLLRLLSEATGIDLMNVQILSVQPEGGQEPGGSQAPPQPGNGGTSVGAGLEGMEPGAGAMPSGEVT